MENNNLKAQPPVRRKGKKSFSKRMLAIVIAAVLVLGAAAGTTLAWLTDKTGPVTNTFTVGDIKIDLTETTGDEYPMVPGHTITKNPLITVEAGSEKCYLFVKLTENLGGWATLTTGTNQDKYEFTDLLQYEITPTIKWIKLDGVEGVYYRVVDTNKDADWQFKVLKDDQIQVSHLVTETMMDMLIQPSDYPTLTVSAYAIQYNKSNDTPFTPAEAWKIVSNTNSLS